MSNQLEDFINRLRPSTRKKLKGRIKAARKRGVPTQIKVQGKLKG